MFIDAVVIKGQTRSFTATINLNDNADIFNPMDLNPYNIRFRVLGAPVANAKVLVEHLITQNTEIDTGGQITNPENGEFTFTITADDTEILGLGKKPIMIDIIDAESNEFLYTLSEGSQNGEFNKVYIVQV